MTEPFELLEVVGKGGMGVVWKARDTATGGLVAVKLLHSLFADDPDYVARFEREVEVTRRIDSPHVVRVFGFGRREGVPYMVMEYVEGQSLRELIRARGPLPWAEAKPILRQAALGLQAAHAAGVIHRDVKPSNILIAPDGKVKLVDFGIARAGDLTRLTDGQTLLGTPGYMAILDEETTPASDIYSLGCVAYELLSGDTPFGRDTPLAALLRKATAGVDVALSAAGGPGDGRGIAGAAGGCAATGGCVGRVAGSRRACTPASASAPPSSQMADKDRGNRRHHPGCLAGFSQRSAGL